VRTDTQLKFRVPPLMKGWLLDQAKRNGASLNSEVMRCIRERMDRITGPSGAANEKSDDGQTLAGSVVAPEAQSTAGAANERA